MLPGRPTDQGRPRGPLPPARRRGPDPSGARATGRGCWGSRRAVRPGRRAAMGRCRPHTASAAAETGRVSEYSAASLWSGLRRCADGPVQGRRRRRTDRRGSTLVPVSRRLLRPQAVKIQCVADRISGACRWTEHSPAVESIIGINHYGRRNDWWNQSLRRRGAGRQLASGQLTSGGVPRDGFGHVSAPGPPLSPADTAAGTLRVPCGARPKPEPRSSLRRALRAPSVPVGPGLPGLSEHSETTADRGHRRARTSSRGRQGPGAASRPGRHAASRAPAAQRPPFSLTRGRLGEGGLGAGEWGDDTSKCRERAAAARVPARATLATPEGAPGPARESP